MAYNPEIFHLNLLAENRSINLNGAAPVDFELKIMASEYLPKYLLIHEVDAAAAAAIGLYTASGGGGTTILAPYTLTGLTAANKCLLIDLAPFLDQLSAATVYLRLTTAAGSAANCHAGLYGFNLTH